MTSENQHGQLATIKPSPQPSAQADDFLELITVAVRVHHHYLEAIKRSLAQVKIYDLTTVQALLIFKLGDASMSMGDLRLRTGHLSSTISYNIKKLVELGYINQFQAPHDRRSSHVRLTWRGHIIRDVIEKLNSLYAADITGDLSETIRTLNRIEGTFLLRQP